MCPVPHLHDYQPRFEVLGVCVLQGKAQPDLFSVSLPEPRVLHRQPLCKPRFGSYCASTNNVGVLSRHLAPLLVSLRTR